MSVSQLRRRIDALKRRFAPELAIIKARRIAESVADDWILSQPPDPARVIQRFVDANCRSSNLGNLHGLIRDVQRRDEVPSPVAIVCSLYPWADRDRYLELFRWDLPPEARVIIRRES